MTIEVQEKKNKVVVLCSRAFKEKRKLNQFFNEGGFPRKPSNPLLLESDVVCFITNIVADDRLSA